MLKSKNFFVTLLVALALLTTMANATVSRLEGLGASGDPAWWDLPGNIFVLHDAATPAVWPQLIQQYPNLAGGEFHDGTGSWDLERVYVNYSWGDKSTALQFSLDKLYSTRYSSFPDPLSDGGVPSRLNVNFGTKLGDAMLLGAGLNYWGDSEKDTSFEQKASIIGFKVGLSGVGDNEWDAVLGLEMPGFTDEAGGQVVSENDGSMGFHFAGRWWWHYGDKTALVPNLRVQSLKDAYTIPAPPGGSVTGASVKYSQIAVGAGHNWWPVENTLVFFDFGLRMFKTTYEFTVPPGSPAGDYDVSDNAVPYWRIGFETSVFAWLDGRLGAERDWVSHKESGNGRPSEYEYGTSATETFIGATAHWNRMVLDMVMNPGWFEDGPNFISGGTNTLLGRLSLKYDFNQ
jgi:hypothetical protein